MLRQELALRQEQQLEPVQVLEQARLPAPAQALLPSLRLAERELAGPGRLLVDSVRPCKLQSRSRSRAYALLSYALLSVCALYFFQLVCVFRAYRTSNRAGAQTAQTQPAFVKLDTAFSDLPDNYKKAFTNFE